MTTPAGSVDGLLAGRYRLDERIAVGGMGEVWRGLDTVLNRVVAVKCLKPEYVDDPEFRERFRAEARHAAGLSHPGIASVYDYGEQVEPETAAWLVMELVDGEPLSALLHRTGHLSTEQTLDVVGQAAMALEAAHDAGVVHRDVKPGNLLVRPDGVVKITDFGIARAADAVPLTRTGTVVGTAYYLSPEQASGGVVSPASDVYSLGVVAYECLAGERPFPGTNPLAVATAHMSQPPPPLPAHIPAPVRDLVMNALEKDPARRPKHAGELGRTALALHTALTDGRDPTAVLPVQPPAEARAQGAADPTRALTGLAPVEAAPVRPPRRTTPGLVRNHQRSVRVASVLLAVVVIALSVRACGGAKSVAIPAVKTGLTVDAATAELAAAKLDAVRTTETSKTVPAGRIIRIDPPAGTNAHEGDDVTLVVSAGKPKVSVVPASYVGKSADAVRASLLGLGLAPSFAYDGTGGPAGTVSSVTPGGSLTYGAAVTVHVVPAPVAPRRKHAKHGDKG
ncbi:MAG: eukaryotic-like serine/threonine-protein kinase [Actinomycetota bacterium]|nr:eukaryotic-like serine/threonine-protein kinase [Actinomycetota bacterium]